MQCERHIILTIDTIAELLKDYMGEEEMPTDAMPIKLLMNTGTPGKLALEFESPTWKAGLPDLNVNFNIRRVYGV